MLCSCTETRSSDKEARLTGASRNATADFPDDRNIAYALVKILCGDGEDIEELHERSNKYVL
jgi:hypothetical protein